MDLLQIKSEYEARLNTINEELIDFSKKRLSIVNMVILMTLIERNCLIVSLSGMMRWMNVITTF